MTTSKARVTFARTGAASSYYVFFDDVRSAMVTKRGRKWVGKLLSVTGFVEATDRDSVVDALLDRRTAQTVADEG
jgi:hypothetical protein